MIGIYDYTVVLTYLSLLSSATGIVVSLSERAHPYLGVFFLLFCGLCDAFDGKVARTKKDRTETERQYGIQIDSLSDLVAFGVLPACIGAALIRNAGYLKITSPWYAMVGKYFLYLILILYVLAAMIRLAYFNVTEEERQRTEGGARKYYTGLPVTSASLIFPTVLLLKYIFSVDITLLYFPVMILTGFAFVMRFQLKKPGLRGILMMIGFGLLEFLALIVWMFFLR